MYFDMTSSVLEAKLKNFWQENATPTPRLTRTMNIRFDSWEYAEKYRYLNKTDSALLWAVILKGK